MPCACRLPIETYPDATDWGPFLWAALHGAAERSGQAVVPLFIEDERRIWQAIFGLTAEIIPCKTCKEHFQTYLSQHSLDALATLSPSDMRSWLRTWFWEVHNWVNGSLDRPEFPFDELTPKYGTIDLRLNLRKLEQPMTKAIQLSGVTLKRWIVWKNKYMMLLSLLGL